MVFTPVHRLVHLIALLPDLLRPGIALGLIVFASWFAFIQRGLPNLWHTLCRGTARIVDAVVGLLLLPDYLITTTRQKQGEGPGRVVVATGGIAEGVLDGAGALYQRHIREPMKWKRPPWLALTIVVTVATVPWAAMELLSPRTAVRQELAQVYDVWREVEAWADVDPSIRAAPGVSWPPRPEKLSWRRHGRTVGVTLRCPNQDRCAGRLIALNGKWEPLHSRLVGVRSKAATTVHMRLSQDEASARFIRIRIARAEPS